MMTTLYGGSRHAGLWAMGLGELCASMGVQITLFVVPLLAVTQFGASPLQLGALNLLESAAALCFGLFIGAAIDRTGGFVAVAMAELVRFGAIGILSVSLILGPTSSPSTRRCSRSVLHR